MSDETLNPRAMETLRALQDAKEAMRQFGARVDRLNGAYVEWSEESQAAAQERADKAIATLRKVGDAIRIGGSVTGRFAAQLPPFQQVPRARYFYWDFGLRKAIPVAATDDRKDNVTYFATRAECEAVGAKLSKAAYLMPTEIRWNENVPRPPDPVPAGPSGKRERTFPSAKDKVTRPVSTPAVRAAARRAGRPPTARTPDSPGANPG